MSARDRRPGIALVITLLGIMVLEVVVAGTFHVAMQQRRIATSHARSAQLEAAARTGIARALARWPELQADSLPAGRAIAVPVQPPAGTTTTEVTVRRLPPGLFLLTASARFAGGEQRRVAVILRQRTAAEFFRAIPAVGLARSALVNGTVDGSRPAACTESDAPAAVAPLALADTAGAPAGAVPVVAPLPAPGSFAGSDMRSAGPADGLLVVGSGYRVTSDAGPLVLVAEGDVTIAAGVHFSGLLLAGGRVLIEDGATVDGAVQAARIELLGGALRFDPCTLLHLFRALPALRGPVRAPGHWWIPAA